MKHKRLLMSLPVEEGNCTHVDIELYYDKGGMNYFTGTNERRGYYLSAQPLTKSQGTYSYTAFTGVKRFLSEAGRFSSKALNEMIVDKDVIKSLLEHTLEKNRIKLVETANV